ncbi:GNAT family N-acetyltransferase [Salibacteraceae bacterium]|nr:GNAT family N-acetyltransferase [Salibacteraceae bacterium]
MNVNNLIIRKGTQQDVPSLLSLIKELAIYEKAENEVIVTEEILIRDGFGEHPLYQLAVAEYEGSVLGIALYYFAYSTWKGRYLYLEDFVVKEEMRGKGIGKPLFQFIVNIAKEEGVKRMGWQVLDWNEPAIKFYETYGADLSSKWLNGRLYFD